MADLKYIGRIISGVRFDRMNHVMDVVKEKCGHNKVRTFFDILWCAARYGAGYYDYVMFGFYNMNGKQRDTYLTRVRNKKVQDLMNPPGSTDMFDDKLVFNAQFSDLLYRKTLNGETCTLDEFTSFIDGVDAIFAKVNHGSCGNGVAKLKVSDFASPEEMLSSIRKNKQYVLEHVLPQHPDMAYLHPQSVNTMRIVTDNVNGNITIAYIVVKMGCGDGFCDNSGQGGVLCRVDMETGKICSPATDDYFQVFDKHPTTGVVFQGYQLPMVQEAIEFAKKAAARVPNVGHIGWDIAITPDGPAIIEGNGFPGTDLCQLAPHYPEKCGLWPYYKKILNL